MQCPACPSTTLAMTERQGIEIDYCPQCRGVWLDRGELDKILERAGRGEDERPRAARPEPRHEDRRRDDDDDRRGDDRRGYDEKHRHKRRESWWSDIFDF